MPTFEREVLRLLKEHGWTFVRHGKGDHNIWLNPQTGKHVSVDGKIKSRHSANALMKRAGIEHKF